MMLLIGASWNASVPIARRRHLAADDDDRNRIGHGVAHRRDRVGRARPGSDQRHADLAGRARITLRHEARALLVRRHDQRQGLAAIGAQVVPVVAEYRVVDRQDRAAGIAEHDVDALVGQDLHDDVGAAQARAGERMTRTSLAGCSCAFMLPFLSGLRD